jgi:hypothetical protein
VNEYPSASSVVSGLVAGSLDGLMAGVTTALPSPARDAPSSITASPSQKQIAPTGHLPSVSASKVMKSPSSSTRIVRP